MAFSSILKDIVQLTVPAPEFYQDALIKAAPRLHHDVYKRIRSSLKPGSKLLDLGSGEAPFARRLADEGYVVSTLDLDDGPASSSIYEHVSLDLDDFLATQQYSMSHSEEYDAVICLEVLEHLKNPFHCLQFSTQLLKQGGLLFITTPNISNWYSRLLFLKKGDLHQFLARDLEWGHITSLATSQLVHYLQMLQLIVRHIGPVGLFPPLIFSGGLSMAFVSVFALLLRPFQTGQLDGSSVLIISEKTNQLLD